MSDRAPQKVRCSERFVSLINLFKELKYFFLFPATGPGIMPWNLDVESRMQAGGILDSLQFSSNAFLYAVNRLRIT